MPYNITLENTKAIKFHQQDLEVPNSVSPNFFLFLELCLSCTLPLRATAVQITAPLRKPHFSVLTPATFFSGLLCHSPLLSQLSWTIPQHPCHCLSSYLLFLHLQRACYLGLISNVGSPHGGQTPPKSMAFSFEPLRHKGFLTQEVLQQFHNSRTYQTRLGSLDCYV